ncbi:MAG: hypothetical protein GF331_25950 [Chitinivibrionales bacterium]|nr:hypothetical protein [Chitinivibrionales bacterium]
MSATTHDNNLMVSAFAHQASGGMSVVIMNTGSSEKSVTLAISGGTAPASFDGKLTTPSGYFADMGAVAAGSAIAVPGNSIVSLGHGHIGTGPVAVEPMAHTPARHPQPAPVKTRRLFDLRGRVVETGASNGYRGAHSGAVIWVTPADGVGRVLIR